MTGSYTVRMTDQSEFHIDITSFVSEAANGNRANYGLIVFADLLGDGNLQLPDKMGNTIRNSAIVGIDCK